MSKKQAKRIEELEKEVAELRKSLTDLALRIAVLFTTTNIPAVVPPSTSPSWPPYTPYLGDVPSSYGPTITCSATSKTQAMQNRQESLWRD